MNNNNTNMTDLESINFDTTQTSMTQSRTLCEHFQKRKLMWIIIVSIVMVLIISGITISTIIITMNRRDIIKTTTEASTMTVTEEASAMELKTVKEVTTAQEQLPTSIHNNINTKWIQNGTTIAGGKQSGTQLKSPNSIDIDDDQTIYIGDRENFRVVELKYGTNNSQVVAGGNGQGKGIDQFDRLTDVIVDKKNDAFITCDYANKRVIRWSRQNRTNQQTIIPEHFMLGSSNG